jgi:aerobic-type carbon monoxide dehydrogenase small subunit (CoxS/CutS family)
LLVVTQLSVVQDLRFRLRQVHRPSQRDCDASISTAFPRDRLMLYAAPPRGRDILTPTYSRKILMPFTLTINGASHEIDVEPETPLLWVLRDNIGLTGTKFGCGIAQCGVCTVHIDGRPARACATTAASAVGREITTIEGLSPNGSHPVQRAWIEHTVPQCGYCQSGQIMAAAALLARTPNPSESDIDTAMAGQLCRCGTYPRIRNAIHHAARLARS